LSAVGIFRSSKVARATRAPREEALTLIPTIGAVFFVDFGELRHAPFVAQLYAWRPNRKPTLICAFVKKPVFDDGHRSPGDCRGERVKTRSVAVVGMKFDRQKISAFAKKDGTSVTTGGREIFSVLPVELQIEFPFVFLRMTASRYTNDSNLGLFLDAKKPPEDVARMARAIRTSCGFSRICRSPARRRSRAALAAQLLRTSFSPSSPLCSINCNG